VFRVVGLRFQAEGLLVGFRRIGLRVLGLVFRISAGAWGSGFIYCSGSWFW